jgi:hypothetical protein
MATLKQIQNASESFWATHGPTVISRQNAYLAAHGHYWQGIESHGTLPDDGVSKAPDLTKKPTDQLDRWLDFFSGYSLPATWPISVRIDVYDGPQGKGWVVVLRFTKNGQTWQRSWNFGPETFREQAWTDVTPAGTTPLRFAGVSEIGAEVVADQLTGVKRRWYVRFILWIWRGLFRLRDKVRR